MTRHFVALFVLAVASSACSRAGTDERAFQWSSSLPAGAVVHLRNGAGDITVRGGEGSVAQISADRSWRRGRSKDIRFLVTQKGNDYYVCAMWRNSGKCASEGYRGRNTGGFLAMFSLFHRTTDATADFDVELPANVMIDAKTTSGDVAIAGMTAGVTARSANGDVQAIDVGGPVSLVTSNGDITFSATDSASDASISLSTSNGDVHAELPANAQGAFDLQTSHGDVQSDFPLASTTKSKRGGHLRGQVGTATRNVKLRTSNGSVVLSRTETASHD